MPERRTTLRPPSLGLLAVEPARAIVDFGLSVLGRSPDRMGDGHSVLVLPGLGAGDLTTLRLRRVLTRSGFDAHPWDMGINRGPRGDLEEWLAGLQRRLSMLHDRAGRKVSLVGWSLGGIYARELAKVAPQLVRQVITLGTPFAAPDVTHAGAVYKLLNGGHAELTPELKRRLRTDPEVPTTAIYSKTDGIVPWQACKGRDSQHCESIELSAASHCGMGAHPQVLRVVVERLSQAEGQWQRCRPMSPARNSLRLSPRS
jgi:pimeloyl-ACP methyl ester carboxylesterase